ncbi:MAG TPA: hypothetical protein VHK89_06440 [Actinomycetota bacterium]|nr:hypothetical protein [Actinomycetota bacterium]
MARATHGLDLVIAREPGVRRHVEKRSPQQERHREALAGEAVGLGDELEGDGGEEDAASERGQVRCGAGGQAPERGQDRPQHEAPAHDEAPRQGRAQVPHRFLHDSARP